MKALGFIETKGLIPAIESADAMLKAAEVTLVERRFVKGGLVCITVAGDVAACKASVDAGASAVNRMGGELISTHVIPRPHTSISGIMVDEIPGDDDDTSRRRDEEDEEDEEESHSAEEELKEPIEASEPVEAEEAESEAADEAEEVAEEEAEAEEFKAEPEAKVQAPVGKVTREAMDAIVKADGIDAAIAVLEEQKVVDLRALAREYNGEFGIAGREITKSNKKTLIEEFNRYFNEKK